MRDEERDCGPDVTDDEAVAGEVELKEQADAAALAILQINRMLKYGGRGFATIRAREEDK